MLTVLFLGLLVAANASILPSIPRFGERIVGGSPIDITDVPYQVALLVNRGSGTFSQYCGGTIITQRVILTAAQCTDGYARTQLRIRVGSVVHNTGGQVMEVSKITQHTGYTNALDNDISLLLLPTYLELSSSIALATLPYQGESVAVGSAATVTGWGSLSEGGSASLNLNKVTIPIVNQQLCINSYTEFNTVTSNMICAGYISTGGADSCQGDTGGPLTVGGTLVGIASWARGCALAGYPGVYTRVTEYVTWIKENSSV